MNEPEFEGVDRDQIENEKVSELNAQDLIRLFTVRLATYHKRHDYSRKKCIGDVALEFRDDYKVNILRIIHEHGYSHPDGAFWNLGELSEDRLSLYDPVYPESTQEGGTADIQAGDVLKVGDDGMLIVGANESSFIGLNKSGKLGKHSLATLRNLFTIDEHEVALIRDGEVIRGVDSE